LLNELLNSSKLFVDTLGSTNIVTLTGCIVLEIAQLESGCSSATEINSPALLGKGYSA
jgi:hypothetical protein